MAKKLAGELNVSLDELISDEDIRMYNLGNLSSGVKAANERLKLRKYQKRVLNLIEITGGIFLVFSVLFPEYLHIKIPVWCTVAGIVIVGAAISLNLIISKKLDSL